MDFFTSDYPMLGKGLTVFGLMSLRYFVIAGIAFLIFYVWKKKTFLHKRIQHRFPSSRQYQTEIAFSLLTFIIFAVTAAGIIFLKGLGYTRIYNDFSLYGGGYFVLSIGLMLLIHDTYFYWAHRLMHVSYIFPWVHKIHHKSRNPSPWAAFSFHPLEAIIEVGILPVIVFTLPVHPIAILIFILLMTMDNVLGHLGYEIFPKNFTRHPFGKWFNTSTHHNMHHKYVRCNYGLYFNVWDRLMGTNHPHYHERFEEVSSRKASGKETTQELSSSKPQVS